VSEALLFGVNVSTSAAPGVDPVADAQRAESAGFDFVSSNDHPGGADPNFETWTMLTWMAARTSRIKVASRVLGVPYRSPAMVAKMAESLDRLSGGRFILGLGSGASDDEFRAFGLDVRTPREKVEALEEAIHVTRGLWSGPSFSYNGHHFQTEAAELEPKPLHRIPIWLGTYGPRALAVTGRAADGWIPTFELAPPERIPTMRDRIHAAAEAAGRDPGEVTLVYNIDVRVGRATDLPPSVLSGPPDVLAETIAGFFERGFRAFNLCPVGPDYGDQVEQLGREVVPNVRAAL
jgi:alkanesulfonate monooxygenase SsuD/methylene tetrahydromethanopterin reductase-like flavin-dependent oxidoreductase (luciferase family)